MRRNYNDPDYKKFRIDVLKRDKFNFTRYLNFQLNFVLIF